ncbi:hypothetical protein LINPERPRIM_LOCUS25552 [Linum perenne]
MGDSERTHNNDGDRVRSVVSSLVHSLVFRMGGRTVGAYFIFIHYSLHIHTPSRCLQVTSPCLRQS